MTQPNRTLTDKDEIVKLAKQYLKEQNSLIDLTGFIHDNCPDTHTHSAFVRDIANKMKRTGDYDIVEQENGQRFLVYPLPKKPLKDRYWIAVIIFTAIISPLIVDRLRQPKQDSTNQSDKTIQVLRDSVQLLLHQPKETLYIQPNHLS